MWAIVAHVVTHSGSSDSYTVYTERLSAIRAAKVADNNGVNTTFSIPKSRD